MPAHREFDPPVAGSLYTFNGEAGGNATGSAVKARWKGPGRQAVRPPAGPAEFRAAHREAGRWRPARSGRPADLRGAGVRADAPRQMRAVARVILGPDRGVVVAGGHADDDRLMCGQPDIVDEDRLTRVGDAEVRHRRVVEQDLVQGVAGGQAAAQDTVRRIGRR